MGARRGPDPGDLPRGQRPRHRERRRVRRAGAAHVLRLQTRAGDHGRRDLPHVRPAIGPHHLCAGAGDAADRPRPVGSTRRPRHDERVLHGPSLPRGPSHDGDPPARRCRPAHGRPGDVPRGPEHHPPRRGPAVLLLALLRRPHPGRSAARDRIRPARQRRVPAGDDLGSPDAPRDRATEGRRRPAQDRHVQQAGSGPRPRARLRPQRQLREDRSVRPVRHRHRPHVVGIRRRARPRVPWRGPLGAADAAHERLALPGPGVVHQRRDVHHRLARTRLPDASRIRDEPLPETTGRPLGPHPPRVVRAQRLHLQQLPAREPGVPGRPSARDRLPHVRQPDRQGPPLLGRDALQPAAVRVRGAHARGAGHHRNGDRTPPQ